MLSTSASASLRVLLLPRQCRKEWVRLKCKQRQKIEFWPTNLPPATEWGYEDHCNGPSTWFQKYPESRGKRQSPIDIKTDSAVSSTRLKATPLVWNYEPQFCKQIANTGRGWRVDIDGTNSDLQGGPLEHTYQPVQFHCHWGGPNCPGSEHTVDGKRFAAELHLVHWNKDLYRTCAEAISSPLGLTVIAIFLKLGERNTELDKLCHAVERIPFKDQTSPAPEDFDINLIFPADHSYWTYQGSLTTPPCYETVSWIVFKNPVDVAEVQLEYFRNMHSHDETEADSCGGGDVKQNVRPPQDLNDREILEHH